MHKLTEKYKEEIKKYDDYRVKLEGLIKELLIQKDIETHKIESRIKEVNKLDGKKDDESFAIKYMSEIIYKKPPNQLSISQAQRIIEIDREISNK